jgi:transcription elongation GreA/GreB family factor
MDTGSIRVLPARASVVECLRAATAQELEALERVSAVTREEVTSDETRSEGKYDTRSTEASYLARGQAWRIAAARQLNAWFQALPDTLPTENKRAHLGSLVAIQCESNEPPTIDVLFLAPVGGTRVNIGDLCVRVISPDSPLGRVLIGLEEGDAFQFNRPAGQGEFTLLEVV